MKTHFKGEILSDTKIKSFYRGEGQCYPKISPKITRPVSSLGLEALKKSKENDDHYNWTSFDEKELYTQFSKVPYIKHGLELYSKSNGNHKVVIEDATNEYKIAFLGKLQHYDFPTRLIDITRSYKVAEYFACKLDSNFNKTGRVIKFEVSSNSKYLVDVDRLTITRMLKLIFNREDFINDRKKLTGRSLIGFDESIKNPVFIDKMIVSSLPTSDNYRIKAQKGAFIFMNNIVKGEITALINDDFKVPEESIEYYETDKKIDTLFSLMKNGFCYLTLFPDKDEAIEIEKQISACIKPVAFMLDCLPEDKVYNYYLEEYAKFDRSKHIVNNSIKLDNYIIDYNIKIPRFLTIIRKKHGFDASLNVIKFLKGDFEKYVIKYFDNSNNNVDIKMIHPNYILDRLVQKANDQ